MVAVLETDLLLLDHNDDKAIILLREDIERLFLRRDGNIAAADVPDLRYCLLRSETGMKDDGPDHVPFFEKVLHGYGCAQSVCVYIVAFVTGNFNQNVLFLSVKFMLL